MAMEDLSQEFVRSLKDIEAARANVQNLTVRVDRWEAEFNEVPGDLRILDARLSLVECNQKALKRLGWAILVAFLFFAGREGYETWLRGKLAPPPVIRYNTPSEGGR